MKTARVSEILDDLIEVCREGEICYRACAQFVHDDTMRRSLKHRGKRTARARHQLAKLRNVMGAAECSVPALSEPAMHGTQPCCAFGAMSDEASALGMCERLEAVAMMRYRDALDFDLPEPVRRLLQCQFDELIEQHAGRDSAKAPRERAKRPAVLVLEQGNASTPVPVIVRR